MNQVTYLNQREGETIPELAKRIAAAHDAMRKPQPEIISRAEAKSKGLKYYFTGEPCPNGMVSKRLVSTCRCSCDECKRSRAKYARSYRSNNPDRFSAYEKSRHIRHREKRNNQSREYRKNNHQKITKMEIEYRIKNRITLANKTAEWRKNNPNYTYEYRKKNKERIAKYRSENKNVARKASARRRSAKRQAIPSWFSEFDELVFHEAYILALQRQAETGIAWHVDHMIPLRARKCCGLHCADNIQVIPAAMNLEKQNKMQLTKPLEWLK